MSDKVWQYLIEGPWAVFLLVWLIAAFKTRRTVRQEDAWSRWRFLVVEILGYYLLFGGSAGFHSLDHRVIPSSYFFVALAVVFTWAGIGLAVWARLSLGANWSARVTLKQDHELIRSGPYKYFRHPIYSGLDLAVIGGALAIGRWRCLVGATLVVIGYWIKAKTEEALLTSQFGPAFEEHKRHTGFLFPKF